jgi:hypothetical protein
MHLFCQDWFRVLQLFGDVERLSAHGIFDRIARLASGLFDCGLDGLLHRRDVSGFCGAAHSRRDRAATLVTEDDNQGAAEMLDSVFNAAQGGSVHYLSGGADDKDIAETLVEYDLGPTRESEHPTMIAKGGWPFATPRRAAATRSGATWVIWPETKRAFPGMRRLSASSGLTFDGPAAKELASAARRKAEAVICAILMLLIFAFMA